MKSLSILFILVSFAGISAGYGQSVVQVSNQTYAAGQTVTVAAPAAVISSSTVTVNSGATVAFQAGSFITLGPGFSVQSGGAFTAKITANNSQFVTQSVPSRLTAGQTAAVTVTFNNTGQTVWTTSANHKLGSQSPANNTLWTGSSQVALATSPVNSGQNATFTFNITAPTTPGSYPFQWQMMQTGVEWFGELTPLVSIRVEASAPTDDNDGLADAYTKDSTGGNIPDSVKAALGLSATTPGASVPGSNQNYNYDQLHRVTTAPDGTYNQDAEGNILHQ